MRCLIRFLTRGAAGSIGVRERSFEGEALTLGRGSDQAIYLRDRRVALAHARISLRGRDPVVAGVTPAGVVVNGTVVQEARLARGDVLQLGANLIKVIDPPAGYDLAFTFELDPAVRAEEAAWQPAGLGVGDHLPGKRRASWLLFALVLGLALLLPLAGLFSDGWRDQLRGTVLPSDGAWNPGPMADVHAVTAGDCEACHQQPFVRVRDAACLSCHAPSLHAHADGFSTVAADARRSQCTDCHRAHDGSAHLVRSDDATCADCHRNLQAVAGSTVTSGDATDFATAHPGFRITNLLVAQPAGIGSARPFRITSRRLTRDDPAFGDGSGLIFPHDAHLARDGIRGPDGVRVLDCGDCHVPAADGGFRAVAMERDCAACHRLDFDPADAERVVPHGRPQAVVDMLVDYYSRQFLQGFPGALPLPGTGIPRPGREVTAAERAQALDRARQRATLVARDVLERRVCVTCHVVDRTSADGEPLAWVVRPVALTHRWFPAARFDHGDHDTTLTPCTTCHEAARSQDARDILMPPIETCRGCHAGSTVPAGSRNLLATGCMACHGFHLASAPLWEAAARSGAK
jgi:predicted CXXCH cytochrome family protein